MNTDNPRRREQARPRRQAGGVPQLPWMDLRQPYPPMPMLSDDQVEAIHRASLRILREIGIELMSAPARALLRSLGAEVDEEIGRAHV